MVLAERTELTNQEIDSFLRHCETGVLTLAKDDEPYAIPISFGYDFIEKRFYVRLVKTTDSEKHDFLQSTPSCRLVIYENEEPYYTSIIAQGELTEIAPSDLTVEHIEQYGDAKRPLFEMWNDGKEDLDIELYMLAPSEISGRRIKVDRETE